MTDTNQRCRTCKWWENAPPIVGGVCKGERLRSDIVEIEHGRHDAAGTVSGNGLPATIVTGPDFGCVHWEGKE